MNRFTDMPFDMDGIGQILINQQPPVKKVPLHTKYLLTIEEASEYFGIGQSKLRTMIRNEPDNNYTLKNGNKTLIKRVVFEDYLDGSSSI